MYFSLITALPPPFFKQDFSHRMLVHLVCFLLALQIEMILLGYTLKLSIKVFRLQQYGEEDFITYYPEETRDSWPQVTLIAEDDRHYNTPVV